MTGSAKVNLGLTQPAGNPCDYRFATFMPVVMGTGHSGIWGVDQNVDVEAVFASQIHLLQQTTKSS